MVHIGPTLVVNPSDGVTSFANRAVPVQHSILVVRDDCRNDGFLDAICEFLDVGVEHASSEDDLGPMLRELQPMAVIADLEADGQDGFHVMKIAARHDPSLPVLLLAGNDPALLGAVDAVSELWGLSRVATVAGACGLGKLVDFICHAARDAGMTRLMRV